MQARSLQFISQACAGEQLTGTPDALVRRVCTDSRNAQADDLFIALTGEQFDGHDFLEEVSCRGVAAVVVNRSRLPIAPLNCGLIAVEDTRQSLGRLASTYRSEFLLPCVAVGGSNGKTTTKELIASILRQRFETLWSEASFNNDIGVPLTLLKLTSAHEAAVLEVGTNHPGELAPLVAMIQPRYGVITSIGREHLEFFGDLEGVVEEEGWLAELLPADGCLFLNQDTPSIEQIVARTRSAVVRVGFRPGADWLANQVELDAAGVEFTVETARREFCGRYRVNLLGMHQVTNALLAMAVAAEMHVTPEAVRAGLAACKASKMRLQVWETQGVRVLDDAYNANADSMLAALQTLNDLPCAGRKIAVLGDMAELGSHTEAAHAEVGRRFAELGMHQLVTVGKLAHITAQAARAAGLADVSEYPDVESAASAVKTLARSGDLILLKASRAVKMERIGETLRQV